MSQINRYIEVIREADEKGAVETLDFLTGFSGQKLLGALQRLSSVAPPDTVYLEIGVFQGLSLVSVAAANSERTCFGIDNFAYFDPDNKNKGIVLERKEKAGAGNIELVDLDYEDALEELDNHLKGKKVGVFFVDGPHDYRSQLMCLELALPYLSEEAVILVDDSNYAHVRQANRDFLKTHPNYKLLFESYTGVHPDNMTEQETHEARNGWWDGINIIVRDEKGELPYMEPPTLRSRELYENEHLVHAMRHAAAAPRALELLPDLASLHPLRHLQAVRMLRRVTGRRAAGYEPEFDRANVYGRGLPTRWNEVSA